MQTDSKTQLGFGAILLTVTIGLTVTACGSSTLSNGGQGGGDSPTAGAGGSIAITIPTGSSTTYATGGSIATTYGTGGSTTTGTGGSTTTGTGGGASITTAIGGGTTTGTSGGSTATGTGGSTAATTGTGGTLITIQSGTGGKSGTGGVNAGGTVGTSGTKAGAGGTAATAGTSGSVGGTVGTAGASGSGAAPGCLGQTLPDVTDYGANGPYETKVVSGTGPSGQYTMYRPTTLGANGFKHPIASWGNGITTTPDMYPGLLGAFASHGFVVIASNSSNVTSDLVSAGLDWMIQQNSASGDYQGKLAPKCLFTIGYSLGGGAAVTAGGHADVVATVSFHGLQGAAESISGPLFLLTSTSDGFVTKAGYVKPCYDKSTKVPTIMATLEDGADSGIIGHLYPVGDAGKERAPAIAWLRLWGFNDQGARAYFYGNDCLLCKAPWAAVDRKNANWQ